MQAVAGGQEGVNFEDELELEYVLLLLKLLLRKNVSL